MQQQDLQRLDVKVDLDFVKEKKIVSLKLYFVTADQVKKFNLLKTFHTAFHELVLFPGLKVL